SRDDRMNGAYLGPNIETAKVVPYLESLTAKYTVVPSEQMPATVARWLAAGHVIGYCQGRMEFGPRALGARSIIGDPRDAQTQSRINLKVKYRESFRPFAPAVLEEHVKDYFDIDIPSPYMLMVMTVIESRRLGQRE